jgi:sigma-B regulation protein RsbU (phosphoserine phosphatase)
VSISRILNRSLYRGAVMWSDAAVIHSSIEWTAACEVQQRFMRPRASGMDMLDYSARCRQVRELGGDCYDFVPLAGDRLAVVIGDASGKGLAAALMIASVQSSLRTAAWFAGSDGAAALAAVNRQVFESSTADRYATLFYGVFDRKTCTLRYVNAGHLPPMLIRRDGSVEWLEAGGAPVGLFSDWSYQEGSVQLRPGDTLLAYTDGVTESLNPAGEEWGLIGLQRAVAKSNATSADEVVNAIFAAMDAFSGGNQRDDATVLALRLCGGTLCYRGQVRN